MKMHMRSKTTPASFTISGFFKKEVTIDSAITACLHRGIPRDLIDVAVSQAAAPHFYSGTAGPNRDGWFSWAGRGALTGLLLSSALALIILFFSGYEASKPMAIIQLLGPDIGIMVGAVIGAIYGWLKPGEPNPSMQRVTDRPDAALLLIYLQPEKEAQEIKAILSQHGGEEIIMENESPKMAAAE